jgi:hypothetical protein
MDGVEVEEDFSHYYTGGGGLGEVSRNDTGIC